MVPAVGRRVKQTWAVPRSGGRFGTKFHYRVKRMTRLEELNNFGASDSIS
jgi:hypothetical protein